MKVSTKKFLLLTIFFLSFLPLFLQINSWELRELSDVMAYTAFTLIIWSQVLGIRLLFGKWLEDTNWLTKIHKQIGIWGMLIFFIHPVLAFLNFQTFGVNLLEFNFSSQFYTFIQVGKLILLMLILNWLSSYLLRSKLSFKFWKFTHIFNLFIPPLTIAHAVYSGGNWQESNVYFGYLIIGGIIYTATLIIYLLKRSSLILSPYQVKAVTQKTHDVSTLTLAPVRKGLSVKPGQYVYLQRKPFARSNPFTVSRYNPETNELGVTIKALGEESRKYLQLSPGTKLYVEGAYGVFTRELKNSERPKVILAGGIGITPFISNLEYLKDTTNESWLFYGNKTEEDIAFKKELEQVDKSNSKFSLVHVLSDQNEYSGETGFINTQLLQRYLDDVLPAYDYFLCGPKVMLDKLQAGLMQAAVPKEQIHKEEFSV